MTPWTLVLLALGVSADAFAVALGKGLQLRAHVLRTALVFGAAFGLAQAIMPLLGWLLLSAKGKPIPFFGLQLPALIGTDKPLAENLEEIHEFIGTLGYYLIGLHTVAALAHHYFMRDDTLLRMLPSRDRKASNQGAQT